MLHVFFTIQRVHSGISHLLPSADLRNQENVIVVFQSVIKVRESGGKYYFRKNIIFWNCTHNIFNFNKYFIHIIFLFVLLILHDQNLWNLCVDTQIQENFSALCYHIGDFVTFVSGLSQPHPWIPIGGVSFYFILYWTIHFFLSF